MLNSCIGSIEGGEQRAWLSLCSQFSSEVLVWFRFETSGEGVSQGSNGKWASFLHLSDAQGPRRHARAAGLGDVPATAPLHHPDRSTLMWALVFTGSVGNRHRDTEMQCFSSAPSCAWLHTHSLEGPQPQPQNCRDSILFVRPANPPIHKKGSQLNLVFWVTFLAWWLERWCRSSYIRGYIASWNKSDLGLWDPRRCSALTSCWCKSSSSPGSFPLCLPAALTVVVSAAIKGQFRWAQVGNIWHDRREKKEEIGNCKGFK